MNLFSLGSSSWFKESINYLMLWICDMLYKLIGLLYQVFVAITQVNLFDRETFTQITRNMYVVMGIAMLFIFAYNIVLMIINPDDKKSTGSTTKVVKETIISLVLVILLPTIFNWMYIFQNNIINSGIISSIILNNVGSNNNVLEAEEDCDYSKYGFDKYATYSGTGMITGRKGKIGVDVQAPDAIKKECTDFKNKTEKFKSLEGAYLVAPTILSAFYKPTNFTYDECYSFMKSGNVDTNFGNDDEDKQICINYFYDVTYSKLAGDTSIFTRDNYLRNIVSDDSKDSMELNALMAIIAGVIAIIMYFAYCIEVGVRVAKLGVLQIVSPIAVMLRIVPKQKEAFFDKWFKNVKNTYLDVFIRILIINFALFAVSLVPGIMKTLFSSIGDIDSGGAIKALATVFIILGILQFGKECPDLIKEFFGNSGRFSVKGGFKKLKENPLTNATRASVYGATTGRGFGGVVGGALSGAIRGATRGYDKAVKGIDTARTERENGATFPGRMLDRARMGVGMETRGDRDDRQVNRWNEKLKTSREDEKKLKSIKDLATNAITKETSKVKFDGFKFGNVDFSNMKYTQVKEYENVLKSAYENAQEVKDANGTVVKTQEQVKNEAYQKLIDFQNEFGKVMKKKTEAGVQALISGTNVGYYDDAFTATDFSTARSNLADVRSNDHDGIGKIENFDQFDKALKNLGENNQSLSENISGVTTKKGYQARKADNRMVKNQGESKKK